jgi:hypothetical protein
VQVGLLRAEEAAVVVEPLAVEQPAHDLERLFHARDLIADGRPVHPAGRLVQRLAGAHAEERAARRQLLDGGDELRGRRRVVAEHGRRDAGAEPDALGGVRDRAQERPGVPGLAGLPPRLKVVAHVHGVEAGLLGQRRLPHQRARRELLRRELHPVPHQPSTPVDVCGAPTGFDSGEPRCRR